MNKFFSLIILLIALSCSEDPQISEFGGSLQTKILNSDAPAYINGGIDFAIEITKNSLGKYEYIFQQRSGEGILYHGNNLVQEKQKIAGSGKTLNFRYIPKSKGDHQLYFTFSDGEETTNESFSCTANETYFSATAKMDSLDVDDLHINKNIIFYLQLAKVKDSSTVHQFPTIVKIVEGDGDISINDIPVQLQTRATVHTYLKEGPNKIEYNSREAGENIIQFSVENQFNVSQIFRVPLSIKAPSYVFVFTGDSIISQNTPSTIYLNVTDNKNFLDKYFIKYNILKNSGKVKINNKEVNDSTFVEKGENLIEFTPAELGNAEIEFIIKDKYNTSKKETISFQVIKSSALINVSNFDNNCVLNKESNFNLSVIKKDYKGKFKLEIIQSPESFAKIQVNKVPYKNGKIDINNPEHIPISFIPTIPGNSALKIKITDDFGSETVKELSCNVNNTTGKIVVANYDPGAKLYTDTKFNFAIIKEGYADKFQIEIISFPLSAGDIDINGTSYNGGKLSITNPTCVNVKFKPAVSGDIKLTIKAYDIYKGEITKDVLFSVSNTDIKISVGDVNKELILGNKSEFTFSASKPGYTDKLNFGILLEPANCGTVKVDGNSYVPGISAALGGISPDIPIPVTFTPSTNGSLSLILKVSDKFGGEARYPISFSVTDPAISVVPANFVPGSLINTENAFTFSVSKPEYTGNFKYSIGVTPENAGKIKVDDMVYSGGKQDISKKENCKLSFIPAVTGNIQLDLSVFDDRSGTTTKQFIYNVTNPELILKIEKIPAILVLNDRVTTNFSISKEKYSGKFFADIVSTNCKEIKIGNQLYANKPILITTPELTSLSFTPSSPGKGEITIKITDEWGSVAEKVSVFDIVNDDVIIDIKNYQPEINFLEKNSFTYYVTQGGSDGEFDFKIETTPAGAISNIKTNGRNYQNGYADLDPSNNMVVDFIPIIEGQISVDLTIKNSKGKEFKKSIVYNSVKYPLEVSSEGNEGEISVFFNKSSRLMFREENYNSRDSFEYTIHKVSGDFELKGNNSSPYTFGKKVKIPGWQTSLIFVVTPTGLTDVAFKVDVKDKYDQVKTEIFRYKVTNPDAQIKFLNYNTATFVNKTTSFNLAIEKFFFPEAQNYTIKVVKGNIKDLKVNKIDYASGNTLLTQKGEIPVSYIPVTAGEIEFLVSVTDQFGKVNTASLNQTVSNVEIKTIEMPVEIAIERDPACNSGYYESYADWIQFLVHDGEKRMDDYNVNFQNTKHISLNPRGENSKSLHLGYVSFPVYTKELSNSHTDDGHERIFFSLDLRMPYYIGFYDSPYITMSWGYKVVDASGNTLFGKDYLRKNALKQTHTYDGDYFSYFSLAIGDSPFTRANPEALKGGKIIIYGKIEPAHFQVDVIVKKTNLKVGETGSCQFTVIPNNNLSGTLKYSISAENTEGLMVNGIQYSPKTTMLANTPYEITFTPRQSGESFLDIIIETSDKVRADVPKIKFTVNN